LATDCLELEYRNVSGRDDKISGLSSIVGAKYATVILSQQKLIKSGEEEVTFEALVKTMRKQLQMSGSGNNAKGKMSKDETVLA
jgi:hypothetical protein